MAIATGLSQSSVSRIETGRRRPSRAEVERWLDETSADDAAARRIFALLRAVHAESLPWRDLLAETAHLQDQVADRESAAALICDWAPDEVPGLLQSREYADALMRLVAAPGEDPAATVAGRLARQRILYEPGRRFHLLTTEHALRRPVGSAEVMAGQREQLVQQVTLESVTVGVVPEPWPLLAASGFVIYDEIRDDAPFVSVELSHGPMVLSDPDDVELYRQVFRQLSGHAAVGDAAIELIRDVRAR